MVVRTVSFAKLLYSWVLLADCNFLCSILDTSLLYLRSKCFRLELLALTVCSFLLVSLPALIVVETVWQEFPYYSISIFKHSSIQIQIFLSAITIQPCIINITTPAYLVSSGVKQHMSQDHFDLLWKSNSEDDEVSTSASSSDVKLSRKEMVIGENRTTDITILSPASTICQEV